MEELEPGPPAVCNGTLKDKPDDVLRRGDEIRLEDGTVGRVLSTRGGVIRYAPRKVCDAHNFWTYYRFRWGWHVFWVHWIGF